MRTAASPLRNGVSSAPRFTLEDDEEEDRLVQGPPSHRAPVRSYGNRDSECSRSPFLVHL